MRGGDYVSTISTIAGVPADISPSSVANIISIAKLSSVADVTRLTVEQITNLIAGIDTQITANSTEIARLTSEIATLDNSIWKTPDGLHQQFATADFIYTSTLEEFIRVSTNAQTTQETLDGQQQELSTLKTNRDHLLSSLEGYQRNYSSVLSTYKDNKRLLEEEEAKFSTLWGEYLIQSSAYQVAKADYDKTQAAINSYTEQLSTLSTTYKTTADDYSTILRDFINYSTVTIPNAQDAASSTLSTYMRLVGRRDELLSTITGGSTAMRLAEYQLEVAKANELYSQSLANETQCGNQVLSLTATMNQTVDQVQKLTISTQIVSTSDVCNQYRQSSLYYKNNLSSLLSSVLIKLMVEAEQNISTAYFAWLAAQQYEKGVESTISGITRRIDNSYPKENELRSTISSLSSIYRGYVSTKEYYDGQLSTYTETEKSLSSQLRTTLLNIKTYIEMSTLWGLSSIYFMSTVDGWSTIERLAQSSLDGYIKQKGQLESQLGIIGGEINALNLSIGAEFSNLDRNASTFYARKRNELLAEVDEFRYAAREYNSYLGVLTSELLIQKLNLFDQVDILTFQIQSTIAANDLATKTTLETKRSLISGDQITLQAIADRINPLEVKFNSLDILFQDERTYKETFIQKRSTLHVYERNALSTPTLSTTFKVGYLATWSDLEGAVTTINTKIDARNTLLDQISTTVGQVRAESLNNMMQVKYPTSFTGFPAVANYPYNRNSFPIQTRTMAMNTDFALLAPIPYV